MSLLLDTCAWIWIASDRARLTDAAIEAIERGGKADRRIRDYAHVPTIW